MKYCIQRKEDGHFLRSVFLKEDAFTDDLGHAQLFNYFYDATMLCYNDTEKVIPVLQDEDGGLYIE
jgi:hypothetical protein